MKNILLNSKLCFGPMSLNIVNSLIEFSNTTEIPITIIPSRRQIEWNGGYVNNWTTKDFSEYIKSKSKYIAIQRDHAGPGQGLNDDDGYESLKYDCKYFDAIHIDPWKKYPNFEEGLKWTIDLLKFCDNENKNLYYEIGTEEAIRHFEDCEIDELIKRVKESVSNDLFNKILFCVIQSGTALKNNENIGIYDNSRLLNMIKVTKKYNLLSKEHNGDYMGNEIMINRFENKLDSINIAPELGVCETKIILEHLINENKTDDINKFYNLCYLSRKWEKWVSSDFQPDDNKIRLIKICGHYLFSNNDFLKIKNKIDNIDNIIIKKLNILYRNLFDCSNKFFTKKHLHNVIRVHPPKNTQMVDDRLRLHRAERLDPFPKDFFNNFLKTIDQKDFRFYPYTHELKEKIASRHNLNVNNVFMNNGSSENIRIFYNAFATSNKEVIITDPSYPMHEVYANLENAKLIKINYNDKLNWSIDDMISKINNNTSCICFANPNSPIGDLKSLEDIEKLLVFTNKLSIPVLIDEAYVEYSNQESCINFLKKYDNLVISRTFSKALGCAGLRIGYLLSNYSIMQVLNKFITTYEVAGISARFGSYLLENQNIIDSYVEKIKKEKEIIGKICNQKNIPCILNNCNTIHLKPKNMNQIIELFEKDNVLYRTRILPHDNEFWFAIVVYPDFHKSIYFSLMI